MNKTLLVIEPDDRIRNLYSMTLNEGSFRAICVKGLAHGVDLLRSDSDIQAMIVNTVAIEDGDISQIAKVKELRPDLFLMVTGIAPTHKLLEFLKCGVDEFIETEKIDEDILQTSIVQLLNKNESHTDNPGDSITGLQQLIGNSPRMMELKRLIMKIGPLDSTVLILGETGTGKEVVARTIHSMSPQKHRNFIAVHCGGIPDTLLESTLFGHEKGAFTDAYATHKGYFEIADRGTIFLDEIGDTTPSFQVKLLRVLQNKQFQRVGGTETLTTGARIIAATNRDLRQMINNGRFRQDLYYRLNVISLKIAALRLRADDIPLLIRYFLKKYAKKHNHLGIYLKPETIDILKKLPWYGNVRELENVIERLVALSDNDWIGPSDLPQELFTLRKSTPLKDMPFLRYSEAKKEFEREYILRLLSLSDGNISKAAKLAEIPRQNLHLKINKHNLKTSSKFISIPSTEVESARFPDRIEQ